MESPLTDLSDAALGRAAKQNLIDFFRFMEHAPSCTVVHRGPLHRYVTGVMHPWFNGILVDGPPADGDGEQLAAMVGELSSGSPPFTLWLESEALRREWAPILLTCGLLFDSGAPGMAYIIGDLPAEPPHLEGFTIRRLQGDEALEEWVPTFTRGYELPSTFDAALLALLQGLAHAPGNRLVNYIGLLDGRAVTTSNLFLGAGVAGIQFVATLPEVRRRGLGSAMTLAPLHEARARGYRAAILQASEMGAPVYRALGFRTVGQVDNYYLPQQAPAEP